MNFVLLPFISEGKYNMPLEIQIAQQVDASYLLPFGKGGLDIALNFVKSKPTLNKTYMDCSLLPGCQKKARKTIIQLMMVDWGIFGLGSSTAGLFLANHYQDLGPYFGDVDGHDWPNNPLAKAPAPLESVFHQVLLKMTELMSHGKLSTVSMLDLPAFGSKIAWLKKNHKREPNWPTEMNFAIHNKTEKNMPEVFKNYKTLLTHWENYIMKVYRKDPMTMFTPEMKVNTFLSFTNHIRADLSTFLFAIHGSFKTASEQTLPIWKEVAKKLFNATHISSDKLGKGLYDKLIMQCGFREDMSKKEHFNLKGGCDSFYPTLTTNGMCHSFNSEISSNIWQSSNITNSFSTTFPREQSEKKFQRQNDAPNDGMFLDIMYYLNDV